MSEQPNERDVEGITFWEEGWKGTLDLNEFMMYVDLAKRLNIQADLVNRDEQLKIIVPAETANALKEALMKTGVHRRIKSIENVIKCGCCNCHN